MPSRENPDPDSAAAVLPVENGMPLRRELALCASDAPILVTGFEPFAGASVNPSWEIAKALQGRKVWQTVIVAAQLPTVFGQSLAQLYSLLEQYQPQMVVSLGLAGGRQAISLERVAINLMDANIPDNAGAQPIDEPVVVGAPAAYFSTLPIKAMQQAIAQSGVPAELSQTAGTFVCNQVMYGVLHALHCQGSVARAGFIHVPWMTGTGARPALDLGAMTEAIYQALVVAVEQSSDVHAVGGATH